MKLVHAIGKLRISEEGELYGLDLTEHGISAYPEYLISSIGRPGGMAGDPAPQPARSVAAEPRLQEANS